MFSIEKYLSCSPKEEQLVLVKKHPECKKELLKLTLSPSHTLAWRAAWILSACMQTNDLMLQKKVAKLIQLIPECTDSHQREILKILSRMHISEKQEGALYDACTALWKNINKSGAVRYNAFCILMELCRKYPLLRYETKLLLQDHFLEPLTHGIRHSISLLVKKNRLES